MRLSLTDMTNSGDSLTDVPGLEPVPTDNEMVSFSPLQNLEHYVDHYRAGESKRKQSTVYTNSPSFLLECSVFEQSYLNDYVLQNLALVVHGIREAVDEDCVSLFVNHASTLVTLHPNDIKFARRMLKYGSFGDRPMLVCVASLRIAQEVFSQSESAQISHDGLRVQVPNGVHEKVSFEKPKANDIKFSLLQHVKESFQPYLIRNGENPSEQLFTFLL